MSKKVKLCINDSIRIYDPETILCIATGNHGSIAMKKQGVSEEIPVSIEELETKFYTFFRINHDYLINLAYLDRISDLENGFVLIDNRFKIPIDEDKKLLLYDALSKFS